MIEFAIGVAVGICVGMPLAWLRCRQPGWVTKRAAKLGIRDRVP